MQFLGNSVQKRVTSVQKKDYNIARVLALYKPYWAAMN